MKALIKNNISKLRANFVAPTDRQIHRGPNKPHALRERTLDHLQEQVTVMSVVAGISKFNLNAFIKYPKLLPRLLKLKNPNGAAVKREEGAGARCDGNSIRTITMELCLPNHI